MSTENQLSGVAKDLFDMFAVKVEPAISPRLAWLHKHGLTTRHDPELESCPESPETGNTCYPWACVKEDKYGFAIYPIGVGMTEEDACIDYCRENNVPHWLAPEGVQ